MKSARVSAGDLLNVDPRGSWSVYDRLDKTKFVPQRSGAAAGDCDGGRNMAQNRNPTGGEMSDTDLYSVGDLVLFFEMIFVVVSPPERSPPPIDKDFMADVITSSNGGFTKAKFVARIYQYDKVFK